MYIWYTNLDPFGFIRISYENGVSESDYWLIAHKVRTVKYINKYLSPFKEGPETPTTLSGCGQRTKHSNWHPAAIGEYSDHFESDRSAGKRLKVAKSDHFTEVEGP